MEGTAYRIDLAHLDLATTIARLPEEACLPGFTADGFVLADWFAALRDFRIATAIARWPIEKGDVAGYSGDTGYNEAPHLHYTIAPAGGGNLLAPTAEPGFAGGGWLFR